jgi:HAD superfamily hydrolase (TIGR01549 family)
MKSDKILGVGDGEIGTMLDIDAVTFDHFMTLVRPAKGTGEDIVFPIVRSLRGKVPLDEGEFLRIYRQRDADYRRDLRENCREGLLDEIVLGALGDMGFETEEMRERVYSSVEAGLATKEVVLYPDTLETLETLRERGYLLGIISNTHWRWPEERRRSMEIYFDVITLSYEHGFAKPHPSIFQATLDKLGVRADRCLYVGDNPTMDVQGARGAGLKTAFVRRDEEEADSDIQIDQLSELLLHL